MDNWRSKKIVKIVIKQPLGCEKLEFALFKIQLYADL